MNLREIARSFRPNKDIKLPETTMTLEQRWQFNSDNILANLHRDHKAWEMAPDIPCANYFSRKTERRIKALEALVAKADGHGVKLLVPPDIRELYPDPRGTRLYTLASSI